jgi:hypothetical protein
MEAGVSSKKSSDDVSEVQMPYLKSRTFVLGLVLTLIAAVVFALTLDVKRESHVIGDQGGGFVDSTVEFKLSWVPLAFAATGLVLMTVAATRMRKTSN